MELTGYTNCSLVLATDLVNTCSPISGQDDLAGVEELTRFLKDHRVSYGRPVTDADLRGVHRLRGRLREVFESAEQKATVRILNDLLGKAGALPQLTNHDGEPWHVHFTPPETPLTPRLQAECAMALAVVVAEAGFGRLRVCEGERCRDVFVDTSRNRSRRFCSPHVCGNRAAVAAYRARQRALKG